MTPTDIIVLFAFAGGLLFMMRVLGKILRAMTKRGRRLESRWKEEDGR